VRWFVVASVRVLVGWIASKPLLRRCSWTGNLGLVATKGGGVRLRETLRVTMRSFIHSLDPQRMKQVEN
jgi:hypothetical protein